MASFSAERALMAKLYRLGIPARNGVIASLTRTHEYQLRISEITADLTVWPTLLPSVVPRLLY
jgi:hypothetical protein